MWFWICTALGWANPEIQPWALPNEEKRQELTRLYLEKHCGEACMHDGQTIVELGMGDRFKLNVDPHRYLRCLKFIL